MFWWVFDLMMSVFCLMILYWFYEKNNLFILVVWFYVWGGSFFLLKKSIEFCCMLSEFFGIGLEWFFVMKMCVDGV